MASLTLETAPTEEPITLAEAKVLCRVDAGQTAEDAYITDLIVAAREQVEADTCRSLVTQQWRWTCDQLGVPSLNAGGWASLPRRLAAWDTPPETYIEFWDRWFGFAGARLKSPLRPLQAVDSITYRWQGDDHPYEVVPRVEAEGDVVFPAGSVPPISDELYDAVTFHLTVGYGDASQVPAWARQAIRFLVAHWYETRQPVDVGGGRGVGIEIPVTYTTIVRGKRVLSL